MIENIRDIFEKKGGQVGSECEELNEVGYLKGRNFYDLCWVTECCFFDINIKEQTVVNIGNACVMSDFI
jgi:hypothetical protein